MTDKHSITAVISKKVTGALLSAVLAAGLVPAAAFADVLPVEQGVEKMNSFRYTNGQLKSEEEIARSFEDLQPGMMAAKAIVDAGGYNAFDSFDQFTQGYYTGTDALHGIDVSNHNRDIDWATVKASKMVDFVIMKCSEGDYFKDKYLEANALGCIENNIPFGVYVYCRATTPEQGAKEAEYAIKYLRECGLNPTKLSYPVYYDIEEWSLVEAGTDFAATAKAFADKIETAGYQMGVYSGMNYWYNNLDDDIFKQWSKWVAAYNTTIGLTYKEFSDFKNSRGIWQFTSSGRIPGISTRVDLNYSYLGGSADAGEKPLADGRYRLLNANAPTKALEVHGGSVNNGANIQLYDANETKAQTFKFTYNDGFYTLINMKSGKSLDVVGASPVNGANVQQYDHNGSHAQQWRIDSNDDGTYTLMCRASSKVLDIAGGSQSNGANVQQYTPNGSAAQRFYIQKIGAEPGQRTISDGTYTIGSTLSDGAVIDIAGASTKDGANAQIYAANGSDAQAYKFAFDGAGYYTITNVASGKALDVAGAQLYNEANVQQYTSNGSDAQKWRIENNGDDTYTLVSKLSGKAVDIKNASPENGANVQMYSSNGSAAQKFVIK